MLTCYLLTQTVLLMKFFKWKDLFDYGNYSKDFKAIGKMKDKFGGIIVSEFFGLKSNMFSIKKKLMVKNIMQQREWVLQLNLINLKMFYLIKELLSIKWKEFKVKNTNWEHMKLTKYLYHVLKIKDVY